jgi:hypothetical protein
LATLSLTEKDVLNLRYGLDDGQENERGEIGQIFNVASNEKGFVGIPKQRHFVNYVILTAAAFEEYIR